MAVILNLVDPPLDREYVTSEGSGLQVRCRLGSRLYATTVEPNSLAALRKAPPRAWHRIPADVPVETVIPTYLYRNGVVFPVTLVYLETKLIRGNREEGRPDELQHCLGLTIAGPSIGVPVDAEKPRPKRARARSQSSPRSTPKASRSARRLDPVHSGADAGSDQASARQDSGPASHEDYILGF